MEVNVNDQVLVTSPAVAEPPRKTVSPRVFVIGALVLVVSILGIVWFANSTNRAQPAPTPTPTPTLEANSESTDSWELPFGDSKINITRLLSGNITDTWWKQLSQETILSDSSLSEIYGEGSEMREFGKLIYYNQGLKYFVLEPSSYMTISLLSADAVENKTKQRTETKDSPPDIGTRSIDVYTPQVVYYNTAANILPWKELRKESYHVFVSGEGKVSDPNDKKNWVNDGVNVTCYVPVVGSSSYIEFEYGLLPAGSTIDACQVVGSMGIQSVSIVK